jgi:hypothetical protein
MGLALPGQSWESSSCDHNDGSKPFVEQQD